MRDARPAFPLVPNTANPMGPRMSGRNRIGVHWVTAGEGALHKSMLS